MSGPRHAHEVRATGRSVKTEQNGGNACAAVSCSLPERLPCAMPTDRPTVESDTDSSVPDELARAAQLDADVVILPLMRTEAGVGVYDPHCIPLAKELREAGYRTEYLDGPEDRLFRVEHSALTEIAINLATGLVGTAMWAAGAALVRQIRGRSARAKVNVLAIDRTTLGPDAIAEAGTVNDNQEQLVQNELSPVPEDRLSGLVRKTIDRLTVEGLGLVGMAALGHMSDREPAESHARQGLRRLASALNWAEDTALEAETHQNLDRAGNWVRRSFGCQVTYDGQTYWNDCPVRLGHHRVGLSIGGRAHKTCSLCGMDLSECEHIPGRHYSVEGGHQELGWCRVCMAKEPCEHLVGETYSAEVISIIDRMDLDEVSLVRRPRSPDARVERRSFSTADLRELLGPEFEPGRPISCDFCLMACPGLT
jgi:hypothetical protein